MKSTFLIVALTVTLLSCSTSPSQKIIKSSIIENETTELKAKDIEEELTLGANQLGAGYSTEVTLFTDSLISAKAKEKGVMNLDTAEKISKEIEENKTLFTKKRTCLLFAVHTYSLERAKFVNWVSKIKDSNGELHEIEFTNTKGVQSVPSTFSDINGRDWHNSSVGCTKNKINYGKGFELYLIPQIKNNDNQNETTILTWTFQ